MSTEKPKKRIVSKGEYLSTLGTKGGLFSTAIVVGSVGLGFLLLAALSIIQFAVSLRSEIGVGLFEIFKMLGGLIPGAIGLTAIWYCKVAIKSARDIEAVTPITRHNTGHLPEVETLVRGSDRPATAEQAELLRAAGQGAETPSEQLLRAAQGEGKQ